MIDYLREDSEEKMKARLKMAFLLWLMTIPEQEVIEMMADTCIEFLKKGQNQSFGGLN